MKHIVVTDSKALSESLKSAQNYIKKDANTSDPLCLVTLSYLPKAKKLSVIACDGHGYFERRLSVPSSRQSRPSMPGKNQSVCIPLSDVQTLVKFIPARATGSISLEFDDDNSVGRAVLATGSTIVFSFQKDVELPDYASILAKAEKGKKKPPRLTDIHVPIHEMLRAAKALPNKDFATARMYTPEETMALLECEDDETDIRIIFMFAKPVAKAA